MKPGRFLIAAIFSASLLSMHTTDASAAGKCTESTNFTAKSSDEDVLQVGGQSPPPECSDEEPDLRDPEGDNNPPPKVLANEYRTSRIVPAGTATNCVGSTEGGFSCTTDADSCSSGTNYSVSADQGDVVVDPTRQNSWDRGDDMVMVEIFLVNRAEGTEISEGYACRPRSEVDSIDAGPVVITVTLEEFKSLPIAPLGASAGPEGGWLPVNMVNVLYADAQVQTLETTILGTPVSIRAIPTSFHWDLGDGNTITTSKPGKPFPSEEVTSEYRYEGWYDVTLTTTFIGQFSVDGGEWEDIDGTLEIASEPIEIFSKSFESRLVNSDVPVDEEADPWTPPRTPDTEGPIDLDARHRTI